jgi:hypothetical protein
MDLGIGGATDVNGTSYEFNDITGQIATINLSTGATNPIGSFDPSAGVIQGASPTPEPASLVLGGHRGRRAGCFETAKTTMSSVERPVKHKKADDAKR